MLAKKSNFRIKNYSFGATTIVKNTDTEKYVYSRYEITFDCTGSWSFDNGFARNVIIFVLIIVHHLILTIARITF